MNTISPDLVNGIVYASDAHEVWLDLQDHFDKVNGSRIYNLQREIATISQGTSSISVYHSKLKSLWDEYNSMIPSFPVTARSRDFIEHLEQQKLFQFLMGLNESYNAIRSQILLQSLSPSVSRVYAMLINEENQRRVFETNSHINVTNEVNDSTAPMSSRDSQSKFKRFNNLYYEYCQNKGHTRDTCYKLVGYPSGFKGKKSQ
ncbi:uncharacterized protein LOC142163464 [Nicotiana tabacum]|uniref:Uncharacterized protein LOC142163464 n=1 Tax=Nicotiana tabacum TaxID=4097 RepID=A0AC58RVT4_TOBAC